MSDEEITYSTVRFGKSSELQTRGKHDETQAPRQTVHRVSRDSGNKYELHKNLNNLTQQYHTLQKSNSLMKEMLKNKSREFDDPKRQKERDSCNRCYGETKVLDCIQFTGKNVEGHWFCCGIKCYFTVDNKHWSGCIQTCQYYSLKLLKIDDDDELKFLQFKVNSNYYWIGLSYDTRKSKWQWIDNGPSNLDLTTVKSLQERIGYAFLSYQGINTDDCGRNHACICERRMDKFPHPVCSMKEK
ncbi:killer cell lectin-like receptor 2 [Chionomys nivalis]|uniref:killer cell lectin-like receptor 2 n=1 Tax=Chionomys nivalis TaxID=269649 RepID=UPI002591C9EB|nr:killer cell lectin-like receptor 2 [Chionomys nivalis]